MNVNIETKNNEIHVRIEGRLDTVTAPEFDQKMISIKDHSAEKIVLDCAQLSYVSSAGLRSFLTLQKNAQAKGGKIVVRNMSGLIKEVFDMTGFTGLFNFE